MSFEEFYKQTQKNITSGKPKTMTKSDKMFEHMMQKQISMEKGELTKAKKIALVPNRGKAPAEYTFWDMHTRIYAMLESVYPELTVCFSNFSANSSFPLFGHLRVGNYDLWFPHKNEGVWYKSRQERNEFMNELTEKYNKKLIKTTNQIPNKIYEYINNCWILSTRYKPFPNFKLIGYENYLQTIQRDIQIHTSHIDQLREWGEEKSLNYLLYGPPGVGKTSLIRTLASLHDYSIFIVNPLNINPIYISQVLNPNVSNLDKNQIKLLVFEDFDRFIENTTTAQNKSNVMSQILNALDGFNDNSTVIRFFTGNDYNKLVSNTALVNRMSEKFEFHYPCREDFKNKFSIFIKNKSNINQKKVDKFLDKVSNIQQLTLRPFVVYVIRYIFEKDYIDLLIQNIKTLEKMEIPK